MEQTNETLSGKETPFNQVPIEIMVSVGKAHPAIKDLLNLGPNSVLALDKSVSDAVELFAGGRLIARGELQENDGQLAVRLTEVAEIESGI